MRCMLSLVFLSIVLFAGFNYRPADALVYVINTNQSCSSTTNACGRIGTSNVCARFRNRCVMNLVNQVSSSSYTRVNNSWCRGIGVNQQGRCRGSSSGATIINLGK